MNINVKRLIYSLIILGVFSVITITLGIIPGKGGLDNLEKAGWFALFIFVDIIVLIVVIVNIIICIAVKYGREKILYVSDLDGTLLRSDERTSDFTNNTINELVEQGMIFSYATARSYQTSHKVTKGLNAKIPLIVYNGAMVVDNVDGSFLIKNFFDDDVKEVITELIKEDIYPIVYSFIENVEKFTFIREKSSEEMKKFLDTRKGDIRERLVGSVTGLYDGEIFYITCIDKAEKLEPFYEKYKEKYHIVYQIDIYTQAQWLEIMPKNASKANAIKQLKDKLKCDKVVVFGDGKNDIDMFELADEAYAVENAVEELKEIATGVIGGDNDDGVARWLSENCR